MAAKNIDNTGRGVGRVLKQRKITSGEYPRIPKKAPIQVQELTYPISNNTALKAMGKDISIGGVRFISVSGFAPKTVVNLKIDIAGLE